MSEPLDPSPPPAAPPAPAATARPLSTGGLVVAILCLLFGLGALLPGGVCSVMGVAMLVDKGAESHAYGTMFLIVALPCFAVGALLLWVGVRLMRRPRR